MFTVGNSIEQLETWLYYTTLDLMNQFNKYIGNLGADLFSNEFIKAIIYLFQLFGYALVLVGIVLAILEFFISFDNGKADFMDTAKNIGIGMFASVLFTTVPIQLFQLSVNVEYAIATVVNTTAAPTNTQANVPASSGQMIAGAIAFFENLVSGNPLANVIGSIAGSAASSNSGQQHVPQITELLFILAFAYAFLKILFGNLKRGGILFIQICVGSLYMFSIPRGYLDGFISWCKQVIGHCFTAFLQNIILVAGLYVFKDQMLIGTGLMLAGAEVPRIAQMFGLDTSVRGNLTSVVHTTSSLISLGKTLMH